MNRSAIVLAALAAGLALSGCGFKPLYGTDYGVAETISEVEVQPGEGRPDYLLGVALRDRMGTWSGDDAAYVLKTQVSVTRVATALTLDRIANHLLMVATVGYALYDRETGDLLVTGSLDSEASYDVPGAPYAAIRAQQDAEERATEQAADELTLKIARYLSGRVTEKAREKAIEDATETLPRESVLP